MRARVGVLDQEDVAVVDALLNTDGSAIDFEASAIDLGSAADVCDNHPALAVVAAEPGAGRVPARVVGSLGDQLPDVESLEDGVIVDTWKKFHPG